MAISKKVTEYFAEGGQKVDVRLQEIFSTTPNYEAYKHLAYFMGFANERFEPETTYAGKRFRSSLSMLLGKFYGVEEEVWPAAVSIELFHNFTLIHDDIVDGDELRRGRPTVWNLVGSDHAINDGDMQVLMSLQEVLDSEVLSDSQKVSVQSFLLKQYLRVGEGQFLDFGLTKAPIRDEAASVGAYKEMVGRKTADLIAASTGVVGILNKVSEEEKQALFDYGYCLGEAYQLCDDLVSIWGSKKVSGKREHGDIVARKKTLPVIWWYQQSGVEEREKFSELYDSEKDLSEDDTKKIISWLDEAGVYEEMMKEVSDIAKTAKDSVSKLSISSEQKEVLVEIIDELLIDVKAV